MVVNKQQSLVLGQLAVAAALAAACFGTAARRYAIGTATRHGHGIIGHRGSSIVRPLGMALCGYVRRVAYR